MVEAVAVRGYSGYAVHIRQPLKLRWLYAVSTQGVKAPTRVEKLFHRVDLFDTEKMKNIPCNPFHQVGDLFFVLHLCVHKFAQS